LYQIIGRRRRQREPAAGGDVWKRAGKRV